MGLRLRNRATIYTEIPDYSNRFYFEDYALFSLLSLYLSHAQDGFLNTFTYRSLQTLSEYEKRHNISCLRILHTYLQCERRATETCSRLHMHRNTVLYHISRIERSWVSHWTIRRSASN